MEQAGGAVDQARVRQDAAGRNHAAMRAVAAGDLSGAEAALLEAVSLDRTSISAWLNLVAVRRQRKDLDGAFNAIQQVLTLNGRNFPGLLMSASTLESEGRAVPAALAYGAELANAPPDHVLDAPTLQAVERYRQEPTEYYYPGLPAIEFYDRSEFPWLQVLEAATPAIGQELLDVLREDAGGFAPYIHYDERMPLDRWRELNHSSRWSAYHFYEKAKPVEVRHRRAPATLAQVPQTEVALRSPCARYSALMPRTRIPPRTGVPNFRLVAHLPLVVPPGCGLRVGAETREWRVGEGWVVDDTIEHEAWNDSDQPRYILICVVWSPRLSPEETAAIAPIIEATDAFSGTVPAAHF